MSSYGAAKRSLGWSPREGRRDVCSQGVRGEKGDEKLWPNEGPLFCPSHLDTTKVLIEKWQKAKRKVFGGASSGKKEKNEG